jgi:hypothetical protein
MAISNPASLDPAEAPHQPTSLSAQIGSPAEPGSTAQPESPAKTRSTRSSEPQKKEFFTPTLVSIGIEIGSIAFLTALLLLLVSLRSGDGGDHGGGSGNGTSGQGGKGEFAATGTGSGMADEQDNPATGSSDQSQDVTEVSETPGTSGRPPSTASTAKSGTPLAQPDKKSNVFIVQDLPKAGPPAEQEPEGAGGGSGFSDLGDRLRQAGAKTGDVQISLAWNNGNDLDLHVETPGNEKIWYSQRQSSCGGELDVDMNAGGATSQRPVENVYWPTGGSPTGKFRVYVHHFANHGGRDPTRFQVTIKLKGRSQSFSGSLRHGDDLKLVREFTFP